MTLEHDNPSITLAGVDYTVPPLAFRDTSKVVPLIQKVFARKDEAVNEEMLEGLAQIVYYGLRRAHPEMTLDAILDKPVTIGEMTAAALVVCAQAALKKDAPPGEAKGETIPPISKS